MELPGAICKISLTGTSSEVLLSSITFAPSNVLLAPFHEILNANLVDPSTWFRLMAVVVKAPRVNLGVSTVYMMEPVLESRTVVLRTSSSSSRTKDKDSGGFILR